MPQHVPLYTVDEYLRLERDAQVKHEYVDGQIYLRMSPPKSFPLYTIDEYLKIERDSLDRHEYLDGHIYLMPGESIRHGDISVNLAAGFQVQLKGTPCRALVKDTKVRSGPTPMSGESTAGLFSYPDLLVVCGEVEYHDAFKDMILNPRLILEVLSPSTEAFCRGDKFERYKTWNPSFTDYLLVSQDEARVEHHQRQADGTWTQQTYTGRAASFAILSIQCTIALADVYDRVAWDTK
jgi:Uma2 family endonuclease